MSHGDGAEIPFSVAMWIQNRDSYVSNIPSVCLRIKNASKFGENLRGFADGTGELADMSWDALTKLRPTILEINNSRCPSSELVSALKSAPSEQVSTFFSRLRFLSLSLTDTPVNDILFLLKRLTLLEGFSFYDTKYSVDEWKQISTELARLNVRAIDISDNVLDSLLRNVDIELLKLSSTPGVSTADFKKSAATFVTVKILIAQDLNFTEDLDAEEFLDLICDKFPRLNTLMWDWSMVDPAVAFDDRTKNIVKKLIAVYKSISLQHVSIVAYTPCGQTKHAAGEIAREMSESLPGVQLYRFSSKGLAQCEPNFSLIIAGREDQTRETVHRIYAQSRNSIPDLRHLLELISPGSTPLHPAIVADFGGLDSEAIKRTFKKKTWNDDISL